MVREQVRVEPGGGVLTADAENPTPLRCLGLGGGFSTEEGQDGSGGDGGASALEQISAADIGRGYGCSHLFPLALDRLWAGLYVGRRN